MLSFGGQDSNLYTQGFECGCDGHTNETTHHWAYLLLELSHILQTNVQLTSSLKAIIGLK